MKNRARFLVLEWENLLKKTVTCAVNALSIRASLEPRLVYLTSWLRQTLWLPCYISLHVALPVEVEWVGESALKPEPPLNCIMWTQWLKLAIVNTCTCDFVRQSDAFRGRKWSSLWMRTECWKWVWRCVWEVQCDGLNHVMCVCVFKRGPLHCRVRISLCGQRATMLFLWLGKQNSEFEGSSQSFGSSASAAASGFLLMTNSRLSPASIIKGTVRQQSKSLVLTRFTWEMTTSSFTIQYTLLFPERVIWH